VSLKPSPPEDIIRLAMLESSWSPCRSKRGVVIFSDGRVIAQGHNHKPRGFECDGSATCKATCGVEALHAEQVALLAAGSQAHASEMVHVKTVNGRLVPSSGPSCVQCSKLMRAAGIAWMWLYHEDGWRGYAMDEFHRLSVAASRLDSVEAQLLKRVVIAWDADQDEEFMDAMRDARARLGLKLSDDADDVPTDLMTQHAVDENDDNRRERFE
jgi:deoxycytidylate deaminase